MSCIVPVILALGMPPNDKPVAETSCAAACLYLMCRSIENQVSAERVCELLPIDPKGSSLEEIVNAGAAVGISLQATRLAKGESLHELPLIAHLRGKTPNSVGHYVFLRPVDLKDKIYRYYNPPVDLDLVAEEQFRGEQAFDGWIVVPTPSGWPWTRAALSVSAVVAVLLAFVATRQWVKRRRD